MYQSCNINEHLDYDLDNHNRINQSYQLKSIYSHNLNKKFFNNYLAVENMKNTNAPITPNIFHHYIGYVDEFDKKNGFGKTVFLHGNTYHGEYKSNLLNGFGEAFYSNGAYYIGEWSKGRREGFGIYMYKQYGISYQGTWKNDLFNGVGQLVTNSSNYSGEFINGIKYGFGYSRFTNGASYEGQYTNDKANGFGVFIDHKNHKFEGKFKNNVLDGKAIHYDRKGIPKKEKYTDGEKDMCCIF